MKEFVRRNFYMLSYNIKDFWRFQLAVKAIAIFGLLPLLWFGLTITMKVTQHAYLTPENIGSFVKHPFSVLMGILGIIIISVYTFVDITGTLLIYNEAALKREVTFRQIYNFILKTLVRSCRRENIKIFLVPIVYLSLMYIGAVMGLISTLSVPEFLIVLAHRARFVILTILIFFFLLQLYATRRLYTLHYYIIEQYDYKLAKKMANQINLRHKIRDYFNIWIGQILYYGGYMLTLGIGIGIAIVISKVFAHLTIFSKITLQILWIIMAVTLVLFALLCIPYGMYVLTFMFFKHKMRREEPLYSVYEKVMPEIYVPRNIRKFIVVMVTLILAMGGVYLIRGAVKGTINPPIESLHSTEITAHRGASRMAPENTMAAFQLAVEQGADWIELDVQQSKDGQIFVMHDTSFKRTTGVRKYAWELDYDEIAMLDAGSFKREEFKGERIPLLSEVIDFAKEQNIRLNIEMKPNGHNNEIEQAVVDLIVEKEFKDYCVITSQAYQMLKKIKEIDESISTVYVMSLALGNINKLTAADAFSIEANSITKRMVSRIHNAGKQVFVWTVNSSAGMKRMMDVNVDNIITDNVNLAYKCVYDLKTNDIVRQYVRFLLRL